MWKWDMYIIGLNIKLFFFWIVGYVSRKELFCDDFYELIISSLEFSN